MKLLLPLEDRFHEMYKVDVKSGCWLWQASCTPDGYGRIGGTPIANTAHRVAYTLYFGIIPKGLLVCHTCDTPSCVNPKHLFLGTHQDNSDDKVAKGRHLKGEAIPTSKLTTKDVSEIKDLVANGVYTQNTLGQLYNVNRTTISHIKTEKYWKHVK